MASIELVVIGASLGGLRALQLLLQTLPGDFAPPVVIVQHRSKASDEGYAHLLGERCALAVQEIDDKDALERGHVYLAPPDYHVLIDDGLLALSTEAPVNHARPSIDVLFESAAYARGAALIAVILTGSTADGAAGASVVKACGGMVVAQDPATAEASLMPASAIAATRVDKVLPLEAIGPYLATLVRARSA